MDGFKLCWTVSLLERQNYYDIFLIKWHLISTDIKTPLLFIYSCSQHKNSTLDDRSSELKRSHSSEYLNNSTMTNSAHNDLSLFAGQLDSARKTLFHRRSSTGSNEDLGV